MTQMDRRKHILSFVYRAPVGAKNTVSCYQSPPSCLKVRGGGGGGVGGPSDYSVSPSPFSLDFGTLVFGTSDSGLNI